MRVEVAHQDAISVADDVEERRDVEAKIRWTRGGRRDVGVCYDERRPVDVGADGEMFRDGVIIGEVGDVELLKADGVVNQSHKATAAATRPVQANYSVVA